MRWLDAHGHLADNLSDTTNEAFIPNEYPLLNHHMRSARYITRFYFFSVKVLCVLVLHVKNVVVVNVAVMYIQEKYFVVDKGGAP